MRVYAIVALLLTIAVLGAGCTEASQPSLQVTQESVLEDAVSGINGELEAINASVGENARVLGETNLTSAAGKDALRQTLLKYPWAESSLVISKDGIVVMAVPENYGEILNKNLSYQPQVQRANREQVPLVSEVFYLEEGFYGISQSYPVFGAEYLGYTDITYRPDILIGRVVTPLINGTPYDAWATQTDGLVIYDTTPEEIGKNLFSDQVYQSPGLQEAFARITSEPSGTVEYRFYDLNWERNVTKEAIWDTAGIGGAEWRIVITRSLDTGGQQVSGTGTPPAANATSTLKSFVAEAAGYSREHGSTNALTAFNNPQGEFVRGDLYIFAYDMNGTVLALPFQQGLIGANRTGVRDTNGVAYIDGLRLAAAEGGGSIYYVYPNPANGYAEELKLSYVMPVDDTWFVGSGIYIPGIGAAFNASTRDALVQRVKAARDYAQVHGKEAATAAFNDLSGDFARGGEYIFAYDVNGTTLALPFQPELIGSNRVGFEDRYGVRVTDWEIAVAQAGGGFVYVTYYNPDTGGDGLKLCYVAPVDREWFVGSGVYAGSA